MTKQSGGYLVHMLLVTSLLIGVLGAVARFQAAPEVAGFKMHALGVALMVFAAVGVLASLKPGPMQRWTRAFSAPQQA